MNKSSQAAIDFIATYGWTIIVVSVAIGALAYFGVLEQDKLLPNKCTLPPGLECMDVQGYFEENAILFTIKNSLPYDIGGNITISSDVCRDKNTFRVNHAWLRPGQVTTTYLGSCNFSNLEQKFAGIINITYQNLETGVYHTLIGTFTTIVEYSALTGYSPECGPGVGCMCLANGTCMPR